MEFLTKYIYAFIIGPLSFLLLVYLFYLYRNPERGKEIEKRSNIIFDDEPIENIEDKD